MVVPAHNEEKLMAGVLETFPGFVDRVIVVDDASTDATASILAECGTRMGERLRAVRHGKNGGVGAAIVTGYKTALSERRDGDLVTVMAGDAQMDPQTSPPPPAPGEGPGRLHEGQSPLHGRGLEESFRGTAISATPRSRS